MVYQATPEKAICLGRPPWWHSRESMRVHISNAENKSMPVIWQIEPMHQTIIQMYEFPCGLCAAHTENSPINVILNFQHNSQARMRATAFLKELSSMVTQGGVGRERHRDRDSVDLSGLCKECWSVNDVCASARARAQRGSSLRRTAQRGTPLTPHCGTKCHSTANETALAHGDN